MRNGRMADTIMTICRRGQKWRVALNPEGTVIGHGPDCHVVIDSPEVSRRHAKIFQMPSNQWAIEDLGSTNGTLVNGQRVKSCALVTEDAVQIGLATLRLGRQSGEPAPAGIEPQPPRILVEDFGTEVFYTGPRIEECTAPPYAKRLDLVQNGGRN